MNPTRLHKSVPVISAVCLLAGVAPPRTLAGDPPVELGTIGWLRNFDRAVAEAKANQRPLLVLFDEVPGCGTCVNYGKKVLSHPLIVEAAETLLVPVAVYNNIKGDDERLLKSFGEPAWNNPVIRIINPDKSPLIPRLADDYSIGALAKAMVKALHKTKADVPRYLDLLAEESAVKPSELETATFAMHCFWEGEATLGKIPGVVHTRPGFLNQLEVVEVHFDPHTIAFGDLLKQARSQKCADTVFARTEGQQALASATLARQAFRATEPIKIDKQPKYYLAQTPYRYLPMTELQAGRVNAALHFKADPDVNLSPRQLKLLETIKTHPGAGWETVIGTDDLPAAWKSVQNKAKGLN
ncbi:MAG: VPGUxxT family thioredoxin-like (seleno)protein, type 2 [Phycisphaerae bacterium]